MHPMMRGMYSAISGLKTHQIALDVTANDLPNVNTVGYKSARTTFKDSLTQIQRAGTASTPGVGGANPAQVGLGVALGSIDNVMVNGAFQATGNPLDVAHPGRRLVPRRPRRADRRQPDGGVPASTTASSTPARATSRATTPAT